MRHSRTSRQSRPSRTEEGQALILVALCVVTLMVAAAFSIDLGSLVATNRRLQGIADLAAIDGSRELTGTTCADTYVLPTDSPAVPSSQYDHVAKVVIASAKRNGFEAGGNKTLTVELGLGTRDAAGVPSFTALPNDCGVVPDSVRVRAGDLTGFSFAKVIGYSGRTSNRAGVSTLAGLGAFTLGSALATVDASRSTLLNPILAQTLCRLQAGSCSLNLTAVGYNGMIDSQITFGALATQLGFGTTQQLFAANLTIDQIVNAAAVLAGSSTTAGVNAQTALGSIAAAVTSTTTIKLADLVTAGLTDGNDAANVGLSIFQLVQGTAAIANGTNAVSIPNTAVTIPNVASVTASISLIEPPVIIGDQVGATRTTKQTQITITPNINLTSGSLGGLTLASITGSFPITINAGTATGTLTRIRCGTDKGIDTQVLVNAASIAAAGNLNVSLAASTNFGLLQSLVGLLGIVQGSAVISTTLSTSGTGVSTTVATTSVPFDYPDEFGPDGSVSLGNTTVGLSNLSYGTANLALSVPLLSLLGIPLGSTTVNISVSPGAIVTLLAPVLSAIDTQLVQPLMESLGLFLGAADVMANSMQCGVPKLNG